MLQRAMLHKTQYRYNHTLWNFTSCACQSDTSYVIHQILAIAVIMALNHLLLLNLYRELVSLGTLENIFPSTCALDMTESVAKSSLVQLRQETCEACSVGFNRLQDEPLTNEMKNLEDTILCPLHGHTSLRRRYSIGFSRDGPMRSSHQLCVIPSSDQRAKILHHNCFSTSCLTSLPFAFDCLGLFSIQKSQHTSLGFMFCLLRNLA